MRFTRFISSLCAGAMLASAFGSAAPVAAADNGPIHIAVITDMSGVYSGLAGKGSVVAVQMAVKDFGGKVLGRDIVVDAVDHRDSASVAEAKAREEFGNGAEMAVDLTNSATALAVSSVGKDMHKLVFVTGAADKDITGKFCSKYTYMYAYDTYALAHTEAIPIVKAGDKSWYGIAPDYAFGHSMAEEFTGAIKPYGGKFDKIDFMPLGTTDFSSYMLAAKNSGAKVLALLNAGADTVNSMKAAKEFGLDKSMKIIAGLFFSSQVNTDPSLWTGLKFADSWYWDQTPQAAAWAKRWSDRRWVARRRTRFRQPTIRRRCSGSKRSRPSAPPIPTRSLPIWTDASSTTCTPRTRSSARPTTKSCTTSTCTRCCRRRNIRKRTHG